MGEVYRLLKTLCTLVYNCFWAMVLLLLERDYPWAWHYFCTGRAPGKKQSADCRTVAGRFAARGNFQANQHAETLQHDVAVE
jgi:hypothetical protein